VWGGCRNIAISLIVPQKGEQTAQACAMACSIKGNVKDIFLPPPDAQVYFATSSPSHQRRRSSGFVPWVAPSQQMHLLLVATTPIGF
jgi:hypothetical protein